MIYIVTKDGLAISFTGKETFNVAKDHPNFSAILEAVKANKSYDEIAKLVEIKAQVAEKLTSDGVTAFIEDGQLKVQINQKDVKVLSHALQSRLCEMLREEDKSFVKISYEAFARFIKNLYKNPSYKSVEQLYGFLEANDLPITQRGTFLAYKKVRSDYFDIHSGTFNNSIGKEVEMPRNEVEDNPEKTCSAGLHVCSYDYLENYSSSECDLDRVVICEVDPQDVVSIPTDYNNAKMRVCKYKVVDEIPTFFNAHLSSYVYGNHADGWISATFDKLSKFYKDFFQSTHTDFFRNPSTIQATPAVIEDFFKGVIDCTGESISDTFINEAYDMNELPTMQQLFQELSKYDKNWRVDTTSDDYDSYYGDEDEDDDDEE